MNPFPVSIHQIGGTYAKPVILPPEVAIGALGKMQVSSKTFQEDLLRNQQHQDSSDISVF